MRHSVYRMNEHLGRKLDKGAESPPPTPEETESTTYKGYHTLALAEINTEKETQRQHLHRHVSHKPTEEGVLT